MINPDSAYIFAQYPDTVNILYKAPPEPITGELTGLADVLTNSSGFLVNNGSESWYFYFLFTLMTGFVIAKTYLGQLLTSTFTTTVRYNIAEGLFKDNSQLQRQRDNALYAFYFLSMGFFLMMLSEKLQFFPYELSNFKLLLFYIALLALLFFGRILLANFVGHIFSVRHLYREYLYLGFTYNKLLGILFVPVNFILAYTSGILKEFSFYIALIILGILIFMKIVRGIIFSWEKRVFSFYLFLYLCALEIVPILLLYKWFSSIL
jgi:hypothetical protein